MNKELEKTKNENGQVSFAAAVYHDEEMSAADKNYWLTHCAMALTGAEQKEAKKYLERFTADLQNEPATVLESEFIRG